MHFPAVLKVIVVFILILIAVRKGIILGHVFMGASIVMGLIFGMGIGELVLAVLHAFSHPKTLALAGVVSLILVLSHSMEKAKEMDRLLESFRGLIANPRLNLVIFPALIGLLPMPGGAIFSAPMVKNIGNRFGLSGAQLSYINYWFRHIWEYWWPLYPGILLTTALAGIDLWKFILCTMPLTIVSALSGYWSFRFKRFSRDIRFENNVKEIQPSFKRFMINLIPIAVVIIGGLAMGTIFARLFYGSMQKIAKESGLIVALIASIFLVWVKNRFSFRECLEILLRKQLLTMFYMVCSILVFKGILQDSRAAEAITKELLAFHIPLVPICIILPFLMGIITGITIAFVGTTFPILIGLIGSLGESSHILHFMMLALASGFVGVMLSPVHLCLLLSNEYFKARLQEVYSYLVFPCSVLFLSVIGYFALLQALCSGCI